MAGAYSRLSPELMLIILGHVPDLPSLYRLICASAKANAAFESYPGNLLDKVIERSIPDFKHLARMVAILGSLSIKISPDAHSGNPPSQPTFETLVNKYKNLPKDVLTSAPPSFAFTAGTPGPRYLLLTAYRIENLRPRCVATLLQNVHEQLQFRPGVSFTPAALWYPSCIDRFWVERALWKLIIYWNIRAIDPDVATVHPDFRRYSVKIRHISPSIGPEMNSVHLYESEEMNCVSAAIQEFLDCESFELFTAFFERTRGHTLRSSWGRAQPTQVFLPFFGWAKLLN